jgi:hypothetical protein
LLQNQNETSGNNLNNIRCEASRHFRNKERDYLKDKINELTPTSKEKKKLVACIGEYINLRGVPT